MSERDGGLIAVLDWVTDSALPGLWSWVTGHWNLASTLGVLGFVLSINNWWRLRPDVFPVINVTSFAVREGGLWPQEALLEVHNAGSMGITLSAVTIEPGTLSDKAVWPVISRNLTYLTGPKFPVRIDARDSSSWTVDLPAMRGNVMGGSSRTWVITAGWYGRRRRITRLGQAEKDQRRRIKRALLELPKEALPPNPELIEGIDEAPTRPSE